MTHLSSKRLSDLLRDRLPLEPEWDRDITGLSQDSRTVQTGDLFFARHGTQVDGRDFIQQAIAKGAAAVLVEAEDAVKCLLPGQNPQAELVPVIPIANLTKHIGYIAGYFYNHPSHAMRIIAITGTNGKTSCAHFIAQALQLQGIKCGIIGTVGYGFHGQLQPNPLTTPDAITLQRMLAELHQQGAQFVALEASSHGLAQQRLNGIVIHTAVFTNLTRDHFDYHHDMLSYAQAKRSLFEHPGLQYAVLNAEDEYGKQWLQELQDKLSVYAYSTQAHLNGLGTIPACLVHQAHLTRKGITASVHTPWGDGVLHTPYLLGHFSLSNLLAVLTVLGIEKLPIEQIIGVLPKIQGVAGRLETLGGEAPLPLVVVDYAHTPDALEQVLRTLRQYCTGQLWCVFGCGGERDRGKRPLMGKVAEYYADRIVITDDNPRHEDAKQIIAEILQGLVRPDTVVVEHDRRRAIEHAISCAQSEDIVLIAGKGHETYQILGDNTIAFSDSLEARLVLSELGGGKPA